MRFVTFLAIVGLAAVAGCDDDPRPVGPGPGPVDTTITEYEYAVVQTFPHDTNAFTEGLIWDDSVLVEGTGYFNGSSTLRRVRLETGQVIQQRETPSYDFGEGIARAGNRIVQLTWTEQVAYIYDATTFDSLGTFQYTTEGWGLTTDGTRFIMSDGSATLYFRRLDNFEPLGYVTVRDETGAVRNLNELEYIDGLVWANIFGSDVIVMIDPVTGRVRGRVDMAGLIFNPPDVLNGIAHDPGSGRIFVTGKRWPSLFEITIVEKAP